jgi:ubiquinone/menaquinone biosynthesis C-methylase UbiE
MNRLENWFCASSVWRRLTERHVLPWILDGTNLGEHVLELGSGPGAATVELQRRVRRVTSLEFDHKSAAVLQSRIATMNGAGRVVRADASILPFAAQTFSSAIAILMLHHLPSMELQDRAFAEIHRVLKPGGVFVALEIQNGWPQRFVHIHSTFVPVSPVTVTARLQNSGFSDVTIDARRSAFRLRAVRFGD